MKRKVVFMFINGTITEPRRSVMEFEAVDMIFMGVGSYDSACQEAKNLVDEGINFIELCGGFGAVGHARVAQAIAGSACQVGAVRYDVYPGYGNLSGDSKWL